MSTDPKSPGGTDDSSGGAGENKSNNSTESKDQVSYETYQKVLKEAKTAKDRLATLEAEAKKREEADLAAKQEFKTLYESAKAEADDLKAKYETLDSGVNNTIKRHAFMKKIGGEISEDYWGLIDLSKIAMDPESRKVDDASVARYVKEFEAKHSRLIERPGTGKLPNEAPRGGSTTLSYDEWLKLPLKEQQERMKDVDPKTL
jgi:hypothetical protein